MNSRELLQIGSKILKTKKISSYSIDSEIILSNLLGKTREELLLNLDFTINDNQENSFKKLVQRRANKKEPIAYILNCKEFWNSKLYIDKHALIPRPETELMVDKVLSIIKKTDPYVLDVGTGSGCIIISLLEELKKAKGVAIDISSKALKIAKKNSKINKTFERIRFLNVPIDKLTLKNFDLIVSNPPYLTRSELKNLEDDVKFFEPKIALDGGNDGLDVIKKVIYKSSKILKINGMLALEIGSKQYNKVSKILKNCKFRERFLIKDFQNNIRFVFSVLNGNY